MLEVSKMWNDVGEYSWGWMMFGGAHMLIFWLVVLLLIVALLRWLRKDSDGEGSKDRTPRELLDERYARGEIDRETYLRMKEDLK